MVCTSALLPAGLTLPFSPPLARLSIFILRFAKLPKSKNYWGKGWAHREIRFLSPFALSHAVPEFVPRHPLPSASDPRHLDDRPPPLSNSVLIPFVSSLPTPTSPCVIRASTLWSPQTLTLLLRSVAWKPLNCLPLRGAQFSAACWIRSCCRAR